MQKMLIADDNKQITSILEEYAKKEGFNVELAYDGEQAIELFNKHKFDIALLDVMMPKKDGFEVCRKIRKTSSLPVIMVTARGEDFERIMGLDIGADDYIVKPFSPGEVMARVRAILRRVYGKNESQILQFDNLKIDMDQYKVEINQEDLVLTKKEFEILWTLVSNRKKVFSRENLLDSLWGYDYYGDTRTIDSHIKRLRSKLDRHSHPNWEIKTVWGLGYSFETKDEI